MYLPQVGGNYKIDPDPDPNSGLSESVCLLDASKGRSPPRSEHQRASPNVLALILYKPLISFKRVSRSRAAEEQQ